MPQSVKHLTFEFGSGQDLLVFEFEPHVPLSADPVVPPWDLQSLQLSCSHSIALKINKLKKEKKKTQGRKIYMQGKRN